MFRLLVWCLTLFWLSECSSSVRPHIIFFLIDDLGFDDVSFHGSNQIPTPNIDALAYNGVILNQFYTSPTCGPSRTSIMTGNYPIRAGMQGFPISPSEPRSLPPGKILPGYFKDLGYSTNLLGKWNLGFYQNKFLPTRRGFDNFLGYYNGQTGYYGYITQEKYGSSLKGINVNGFDLRRNETSAFDLIGKYATEVFTDEAVAIINQQDSSSPMLLFVSHLGVHAGNDEGLLLEAPPGNHKNHLHIEDPNRRVYAGMVTAVDKSLGRIVEALAERDLLHNSIIVVMSDNGAPTVGSYANYGSNYPLRGIKGSTWEGAVRTPSFIWSPALQTNPRVSTELFHVSDWLPTLYEAAGGDISDLPELDGRSQWSSLINNEPSPRSEILIHMDDVYQLFSIRQDDGDHAWKLVKGAILNDTTFDGWYVQGTNELPEENPSFEEDVLPSIVLSPTYKALKKDVEKGSLLRLTTEDEIAKLRHQATIRCPDIPEDEENICKPELGEICLFDLKQDPCERKSLTQVRPDIADQLEGKMEKYMDSLVPQESKCREPEVANPAFFNGTWSPWYDDDGQLLAPNVSQHNKDRAAAYLRIWRHQLGLTGNQTMASTVGL